MRSFPGLPFLLMLTMTIAAVPARADDACNEFKWDIGKERALFASNPTPVTAAKQDVSIPPLELDKLFGIELTAQSKVSFRVAPGKRMVRDDTYAGLLSLKSTVPGTYRIAVDVPLWIDVVADDMLIAPKDYQGQPGCDAPHKVVEFDLSAMRTVVIQLSGSTKPTVRLTITHPVP